MRKTDQEVSETHKVRNGCKPLKMSTRNLKEVMKTNEGSCFYQRSHGSLWATCVNAKHRWNQHVHQNDSDL